MRRIILAVAVALTAVGALPAATVQSNTFTVDCNRGQRLATALEQGDLRKPVVINVRGTCREFVTITRDNVTLQGDPAAYIDAPNGEADVINIGANGVSLRNLTLTGGFNGLRVNGAFRSTVEKCVIQDARGNGMSVFVGDVRLMNSTLQRAGGNGVLVTRGGSVGLSDGSQVLNNAGAGIYARYNSTVIVSGTTIMRSSAEGIVLSGGSRGDISGSVIKENGAVGLNVGTGASASVINTTISGNGIGDGPQGDGIMLWGGAQGHIAGTSSIIDNRDEGIDVAGAASAYVTGPTEGTRLTVAGNGGDGIMGYLGANLVLGGLEIEGNGAAGVSCQSNCTAQMEDMSIHGNKAAGINLAFDSTLMLFGPAIDVTGNVPWDLYCHDAESSVNDMGLVTGTISEKCTGFD
jgi:hypothetical protein